MPTHPLTNFEIPRYYQNDTQLSSKRKPKFGVYSRNNLSKKGWHICNKSWWVWINKKFLIALHGKGNNREASYDAIYFDSFGVEHIPRKTKTFTVNKSIITNKSISYSCIGFIDFMFKK